MLLEKESSIKRRKSYFEKRLQLREESFILKRDFYEETSMRRRLSYFQKRLLLREESFIRKKDFYKEKVFLEKEHDFNFDFC